MACAACCVIECLHDPRLDDFAASLVKDSSALILVAEPATIADFTSAVTPFGDKGSRPTSTRRTSRP